MQSRRFASSFLVLNILWVIAAPQFHAQVAQVSPPPASANRCSSAEYQEMDFLLGSWEVSSKGKKSADVTIERTTQSGCGLIETW